MVNFGRFVLEELLLATSHACRDLGVCCTVVEHIKFCLAAGIGRCFAGTIECCYQDVRMPWLESFQMIRHCIRTKDMFFRPTQRRTWLCLPRHSRSHTHSPLWPLYRCSQSPCFFPRHSFAATSTGQSVL